MPLPSDVQHQLDKASAKLRKTRTAQLAMLFESRICGDEWDRFIEWAATQCYAFIQECLGDFHQQPQPVILPINAPSHSSGANASFQPDNGQIRLCGDYVRGKAGTTLEKLCHELIHANLNNFPEGDPFYEEAVVDYSVWCMAHAPYWGEHRGAMLKAAAHNIALRRDRAMRTQTDYDAKRWAGGLYVAAAYGPYILFRLRQKKLENDLTW